MLLSAILLLCTDVIPPPADDDRHVVVDVVDVSVVRAGTAAEAQAIAADLNDMRGLSRCAGGAPWKTGDTPQVPAEPRRPPTGKVLVDLVIAPTGLVSTVTVRGLPSPFKQCVEQQLQGARFHGGTRSPFALTTSLKSPTTPAQEVTAALQVVKGRDPQEIAQYTAREIEEQILIDAGSVLRCYGRELKKHPGFGGTLVMVWKTDDDGRVVDVVARDIPPGFAEVGVCVATVIATWRFPRRFASSLSVVYPFVFEAVRDDPAPALP